MYPLKRSDSVARREQPLTRERILATALKMVDQQGIASLSMRRLGAKLGVNGVSLYYHFASKTQIVDGLVALVMSEVDLAPEEAEWSQRLARIHSSQRSVLVSHPNLLPAAIMRPFNTLEAVRVSDTTLATLLGAGFDEEGALYGFQTLRAYVVGHALGEIVGLLADPPTWENRERLTVQEFGEHNFRNVLRIVPVAALADNEHSFLVGLESILEGLRDRLRNSEQSSQRMAT
jgi:TetR/AcrR family tetracycline transcriptional repressor